MKTTTKLLIVGAAGVGAYFLWRRHKKKASAIGLTAEPPTAPGQSFPAHENADINRRRAAEANETERTTTDSAAATFQQPETPTYDAAGQEETPPPITRKQTDETDAPEIPEVEILDSPSKNGVSASSVTARGSRPRTGTPPAEESPRGKYYRDLAARQSYVEKNKIGPAFRPR